MILIILVIYFVILIIIEFVTIVLSNLNKKEPIKVSKIIQLTDLINIHNLIYEIADEDLHLKNYIGKFYIKNNHGFFINLDNWNLLEPDLLYDFTIPVNIQIIKIKNDENIEYFIEKNNNNNNNNE